MEIKRPSPQVFLSYARANIEFAKLISDKLEEEYLSVWIDQDDLHLGDNWKEAIDEGIKSSFLILVLLSPASYKSTYVTYEWAFAMGLDKKIIPLLLEPGGIHPKLNDLQRREGLDFSNQNSIPWQELTKEIALAFEYQIQKAHISINIFNSLSRKQQIILANLAEGISIPEIATKKLKKKNAKGVKIAIQGIPSNLGVKDIREAIYYAKALRLESPV